jgi:putative nucleotidyltransferase with HDIG domain
VLEGLRDALRSKRREWQMAFVVGPEAALAELDREEYEVVVSDMGMPGMDGGELLSRVRDLQPESVRIVMSGSVELNVVARAAAVAHRLLAKPCDIQDLTLVIERACELGELTRRESQRRAATGAAGLPAAPGAYGQLMAALGDPETSARDVAEILEQDVGMAAKVLQLANSAFFGRREPITRFDHAVTHLGLGSLAAIALSVGAYQAFRPARHVGTLSIDALQRHSTLVATIARDLARAGPARDAAFAAGLLHDVGMLVLASEEPAHGAAEYERHAEVGAHLLNLWGVPHTIVDAVAFHHRLPAGTTERLDAVAAVALAEVLAHAHEPAPQLPPETGPEELARLDALPQAAGWHALARRAAERES